MSETAVFGQYLKRSIATGLEYTPFLSDHPNECALSNFRSFVLLPHLVAISSDCTPYGRFLHTVCLRHDMFIMAYILAILYLVYLVYLYIKMSGVVRWG